MPFDINIVRDLVKSGKSAAQIAEAIGEPRTSVWRYVEKHNLGPWVFKREYDAKPVPDNFAALAPTMPIKAAQAHWHCSNTTIHRWYKETGVKPAKRQSTMIVIPAEKLEAVRGMFVVDAAKKLGVSVGVAARAMKNMPRAARPKQERVSQPYKPRPTINKPQGSPLAPVNRYQRDMSPEGLAVDCLQRDRWAVFRCNDEGKPSVGGKYWIVGKSGPIDKTELLERADRAARRMGETATWRSGY